MKTLVIATILLMTACITAPDRAATSTPRRTERITAPAQLVLASEVKLCGSWCISDFDCEANGCNACEHGQCVYWAIP